MRRGMIPATRTLIGPLLSKIDSRSPTINESMRILRQKPCGWAALGTVIPDMFRRRSKRLRAFAWESPLLERSR